MPSGQKTISTVISLQDKMTAPINSIIRSLNSIIDTMENAGNATDSAFDASVINDARSAIDQATKEMEEFGDGAKQAEEKINSINTSSVDLLGTITKLAGAVGGIAAVKELASSAMDDYSESLNASVQLASVLNNTADDASASFDAIAEKAQEIQDSGIYDGDAMIGAGAELATYMSDPEAITKMMDTLSNYAMGMTGGGEIDQTAMVDYATNLGKIMSGSYDAMTKKGFEFTDAQKAVIDGTATQAQKVEALGKDYASMSDDMQAATVIADIIDESWSGLYETMSQTPEGQIIQLKNTIGDLKEELGGQLYSAFLNLANVANENMPQIEELVYGVGKALSSVINILTILASAASVVIGWFQDKWSTIAPIIMTVVGALLAYTAAQKIAQGIEAASATIKGIAATATAIYTAATTASTTATASAAVAETAEAAAKVEETAATASATAAQFSFNAALAACPLTWIITAIIAIIAVILLLVGYIEKTLGVTNSVLGGICGTISVAIAFIKNLFVGIYNFVITIIVQLHNAFANFAAALSVVFNNPIAAAKAVFLSLLNYIVGIMSAAANIIDAVLGSNLAAAVSGWQANIQAEIDSTIEDAGGDAADIWTTDDLSLERTALSDAFASGSAFGDGISDALSGGLGADLTDVSDILSSGGGIADDVSDIANNTSGSGSTATATDEILKYIRDIAETEAVNKFTTAEIKVEMTNNNNVAADTDVDGIITYLVQGVSEAMSAAAEGVYA